MRTAIICTLAALTVTAANVAEDNKSAKDILPGCKEYEL
jgi:hypothetical protein